MSYISKIFNLQSKKRMMVLGRLGTIRNEKVSSNIDNNIEKNIYWGNHDNCGSELCKTPIKIDIKNESTINKEKIQFYENDPYWPYVL